MKTAFLSPLLFWISNRMLITSCNVQRTVMPQPFLIPCGCISTNNFSILLCVSQSELTEDFGNKQLKKTFPKGNYQVQ